MAEIVGIRFKRAGKVYYFEPAGIDLEVNDYVVVKTSRGLELGRVVISPKQVLASEVTTPLKSILRKAEAEDIERAQEFESKEQEALIECGKLIAKLGLPMKLLFVEYNLDGSRLTFLFGADERIDFRELVRELTNHFKLRVELRQVGPRDEAKLIGGFGRCGRPLCCMSFLSEFAPVSIRMAKEQALPLNPMKISGVCGRLLCCLVYESEQYHTMKEKLPKQGQQVSTDMGVARVIGTNPLKETIVAELENGTTVELPLSKITIDDDHPNKRRKERGKR
ncbi:MAG: stage 0 sporulation family protein [Chloroflexi bacterium]|nr:stage 0 sporulation family protein [Chloroflexota bacterium]